METSAAAKSSREERGMSSGRAMNRARFVKHKDRMILHFDFSGLGIEEARQVSQYVMGLVKRMPPRSLLTLVDVSGVQYNDEFKALSAELAEHNKPFVLAGAVVGVEGWRKLIFWATTKVTGRDNLKLFDGVEEAKEWLVAYTA